MTHMEKFKKFFTSVIFAGALAAGTHYGYGLGIGWVQNLLLFGVWTVAPLIILIFGVVVLSSFIVNQESNGMSAEHLRDLHEKLNFKPTLGWAYWASYFPLMVEWLCLLFLIALGGWGAAVGLAITLILCVVTQHYADGIIKKIESMSSVRQPEPETDVQIHIREFNERRAARRDRAIGTDPWDTGEEPDDAALERMGITK